MNPEKSIPWQIATLQSVRIETSRVKTYTFSLPRWRRHAAGQHYDIRLTAPDGYQAQRSYSIASEPERSGEIDLTVERIADGEVSTYLDEVLAPGDQVELRGPIGGYFVWEAAMGGPLLLVGGGSGVVPLMAMIRHRAAAGSRARMRLLYSTRSPDEAIYRDELAARAAAGDGFELAYTFTRAQPPGWDGYARRIDREMLQEVLAPLGAGVLVYVCGPTALVERVATTLVESGITPERVRTERFGPTG